MEKKKRASKKVLELKKNESTPKYLVITTFVDSTYENEFFNANEDYTVNNIAEHICNKHNQFYFKEDSPEPKIREIVVIELTQVHQYTNLDTSFNENKKKFLKSKINKE